MDRIDALCPKVAEREQSQTAFDNWVWRPFADQNFIQEERNVVEQEVERDVTMGFDEQDGLQEFKRLVWKSSNDADALGIISRYLGAFVCVIHIFFQVKSRFSPLLGVSAIVLDWRMCCCLHTM